MKKLLLFLFLSSSLSALAQSSDGRIEGSVTHNGEPVPGVNVGIESLQKGSASDKKGKFAIQNISPGTYRLRASAVGYRPVTKDVAVQAGETTQITLELEESLLELDQVVVTGTMKETYVKDSPVKVNVVSNKFLEKNPSNNIMESVGFINGLYNEVSCGVCGTSSIRINGMEGPYTSVLIDGMPIMGSLASVYGLNGINPGIIESIEIIKGPNSTLYGSEAMGGVINVRTKDPATASRLNLSGYTSSHLENNLDFSYSPPTEGFQTFFSGNAFYFDRFLDHNNDNFADATKRKRISLFNKWSITRPQARRLDIALKYYFEDRLGGTPEYSKELRGSDTVYGEYITTNRLEVIGTYELPLEETIRLDYSYSYHDQDSYYGDYRYQAGQQIFFTNLVWDKRFRYDRQLLLGSTIRYDALDQTFDEQRLDDGSEDRRFTPGIFGQYEHIFSEVARMLAGLRVDHYSDHGFIFSPRFNLKLSPTHHTTIRFNAGTGFRIVNLFTEEHDILSGSRQVVISESLDPEKSYNGTVNINQIVDIGNSVLNMDFDLFYTRFSNRIIPNYSNPNEIRYSNLQGHSVSQGLAFTAAHNFPGPLQYSVGITFQDVYQDTGNGKDTLPFAPNFTGNFSISYGIESIATYFDYTGRLVGSMELPEYPDAVNKSEIYTEQNVKVSKRLSENIEVYGSVKNIFNYTQENPLIAPDRPFSDDFATDHVFGPIQERRFLIGINFNLR
ncbi:TonB-dependent receptor [Balneolaceae bacterium YR4-1]|uniref:TonB-dependent receptor n=1 Tax=Halalkalibaculum roseum TaxID=2709311 RepID=A0A6M1SRQ1_9BACT|nr:TonB-dependent receptor [Halalkalibaculum roseum]NGP75500.1 TonB-dependent receptor [Halalkalibaculum roseum]